MKQASLGRGARCAAPAQRGGALTAATLAWHRVGRRDGAVEVPYGVAIAGATVAAMANHILTNPVA